MMRPKDIRLKEWKKLLAAAQDSPHCMSCLCDNDGTIVAAHSNQLRDGKGTGIKAKDYRVAYLCHRCHSIIDSGNGTRAEKFRAWDEAHLNTVAFWFENGYLTIN